MNYDALNTRAARRLVTESLPLFSIVEAKYAPLGSAPEWAAHLVGSRAQWLVNGDTGHMTWFCRSRAALVG